MTTELEKKEDEKIETSEKPETEKPEKERSEPLDPPQAPSNKKVWLGLGALAVAAFVAMLLVGNKACGASDDSKDAKKAAQSAETKVGKMDGRLTTVEGDVTKIKDGVKDIKDILLAAKPGPAKPASPPSAPATSPPPSTPKATAKATPSTTTGSGSAKDREQDGRLEKLEGRVTVTETRLDGHDAILMKVGKRLEAITKPATK
jgi:hypothetical protein